MCLSRRRFRQLTIVAVGCACVACSQDNSIVEPDTNDPGGGGTVQRASLALTLSIDPADSTIATAIGAVNRILSGAQVSLRRRGSTAAPLTATTDADGRLQFDDLLPGDYDVSALRTLTSSERQALALEDQDVTALAAGRTLTVTAPSVSSALAAVAGRRGSLVISEVLSAQPGLPGGYPFGTYMELYNNSDTTIYLDGKVIVRGISWRRDYNSPRSCDEMEQWRNDPSGIWSRFFYAFPGTGQTYPLAPGEAVVVATDAIDHSGFVASMQDLSQAQFEFLGPFDVDNPSAANMVNIGLGEWAAIAVLGHGLDFAGNDYVLAITDPLDISALPRDNLPVNDPEYARAPRDKVLDVISSGMTPAEEAQPFLSPLCPELVNAVFDRQGANLIDSQNPYGIRRKPLYTLPNGHVVLQRTKTSARDFEARSPASPGVVP